MGQTAALPLEEQAVKRSGGKEYRYMAQLRYICIREATAQRPGILLKTLGAVSARSILLLKGEPYCKDEKTETFEGGAIYDCYRFPTADHLRKVLVIVRADEALQELLAEKKMPIDPSATFWVRDTQPVMFGLSRLLQYYDPASDGLVTYCWYERHQRITLAYFTC